jgi:hypothetical protein
MSRNSTAYFAIVGTLAFALPGAASAGQVNIPHINIRPQISVPTPHPSVPTPRLSSPKLSTPNLVIRPQVTSGLKATTSNQSMGHMLNQAPGLGLPQKGNTISGPGSASAMPVSNTGGDFTSSAGASAPSSTSGSPSYSGGYSTAGKANTSPSLRCRSKGGVSNCP